MGEDVATRLPAEAKVRRDASVIADRARGLSWATVAQRHQLSERHCREIWATGRTTDLNPRASLDALADILAQLDAAIEDLALLAETTRNDAVRLGAVRARLAAMADRFEVMQACGLLPRDLGLFRLEIDVREMTRVIVDAFDAHAIPGEARCAVLHALRRGSIERNGNGTPGHSSGASRSALPE